MSAFASPTPKSLCPPIANTRPSDRTTAALQNILVRLFGIEVNRPVVGLQSRAEVPPFDGGPSQDMTSPARVTTMLIATMGQLNGALQAPTKAGSVVFVTTVTLTGEEVVRLPAASRATAVIV